MQKVRVERTALAGLTLAIAVLMSNGVGAGTTICLGPGAAGAAWQSKVPMGSCAAPDDAGRVCKAWLKTCKRVVGDAAKCRNGEIASGAALDKARCKLSTITDSTQCKASAADQARFAKDQVKNEKETAREACAAYVPTCIFNCNL